MSGSHPPIKLWLPMFMHVIWTGECSGNGGASAVRGHNLYQSRSLVWCRQCGCYGETKPRNLLKGCAGSAKGGAKTPQLGCLLRGVHPSTGVPLGRTVKL